MVTKKDARQRRTSWKRGGSIKQIGMRTGTGEEENSIIRAVDQKPVRENMAFAESRMVPGQCMVPQIFRERTTGGQKINSGLKQGKIAAAFSGETQIPAEAVGKNNVKHRA